MLYVVLVLAIFATLLFILALCAESINSRLSYGAKDEFEKLRAVYKIILAVVMSFSWGYVFYTIIKLIQ